MLEFKPHTYLAFELSPTTRGHLLEKFPPAYEKVVCHHVTIVFRPTESEFKEVMRKMGSLSPVVECFGRTDENGVECLSVMVNDHIKRPFNGFYHVTHSLQGNHKPVESNKILEARKGVPAERFDTGAILLRGELKLFPL
jgi:hypothetical protein